MRLRFYIDPVSQTPHIHGHGVEEDEVEAVIRAPLEDRPGRDGSRVAMGQTRAGRYLRVIYTRDHIRGQMRDDIFVITAYELSGKQIRAFRRRYRRKRR